MTEAHFDDAVLAGSEAGQGKFDFTGANLTGATFTGTQCIACNFTNATLTGASLDDAYLPGAELSSAQIGNATFAGTWLYCGGSDVKCETSRDLEWPLALGSQEDYGPVPYTSTDPGDAGNWSGVRFCPNGFPPNDPDPGTGCSQQLLASGTLTVPVTCAPAALDACPTETSTIFPLASPPGVAPIALVPATPATWANEVTDKEGYYVGLADGTVRRVAGDGTNVPVAGQAGRHCSDPTAACGDGGQATQAQLGTPAGLAVGPDGALYIADADLHKVRRVDPASGLITTVAGNGQSCADPRGCGGRAGGDRRGARRSGRGVDEPRRPAVHRRRRARHPPGVGGRADRHGQRRRRRKSETKWCWRCCKRYRKTNAPPCCCENRNS